MKRAISQVVAVCALLTSGIYVSAQGIDDYYTNIRPVQPTQVAENKVEVIEFFSYACNHCYSFEPYIVNWQQLKPENAEFRRVPVVFAKNQIPLARAYYTAEKIGVLDKIHHALFEAIHKDKRNIFDDNAIRAFFIEQGVNGEEFSRAYNSMEVTTKTRQAEVMMRNFKVPHTPSLAINGKYLTSPSMADGFDNLDRVMDSLIARESGGP